MPENDESTYDDKGNKEFPRTAEQEITDRLEMKRRGEKNQKITGLITHYLSPRMPPPSLPISSLFFTAGVCWSAIIKNHFLWAGLV